MMTDNMVIVVDVAVVDAVAVAVRAAPVYVPVFIRGRRDGRCQWRRVEPAAHDESDHL